MSAIQLGFTLRTSTNVKTVHLVGSWDNYAGQLPLSKDAAKAGSWKGTFRFQGATLQAGQRYWYYYMMDGYHASHDPAKPSTKEPTTGRSLNILDVPASARTAASGHKSRGSAEIPVGRALSPARIQHPKPSKPYASRTIREADYSISPEDLADQLEEASLHTKYSASPASSVSSASSISESSLSSRSNSSSLSSLSSLSSGSACTCNRYGITRKGDRVKMDCGGSRCGYDSDSAASSECSSDSESEEEEEVVKPRSAARVAPRVAASASRRR